MALGRVRGSHDFNMTNLAIHGSRFQNGVSKIHGNVSARICRDLWPQIEPEENPMAHITNGVHVPTFLAQEWPDLFDRYLGYEWRNNMCDTEYWSRIERHTRSLVLERASNTEIADALWHTRSSRRTKFPQSWF